MKLAELKNCIEGMVVMTSNEGILGSEDVPGYIRRRENVSLDNDFKVGMSMREIEKTAIKKIKKILLKNGITADF